MERHINPEGLGWGTGLHEIVRDPELLFICVADGVKIPPLPGSLPVTRHSLAPLTCGSGS
jgi:hypothetical protein